MEKSDIIKDQNRLLTVLLGATLKDYKALPEDPERPRCDIIVGANANNFSFRSAGKGISMERLVRALYPLEGETPTFSELYPVESMLAADVVEIHLFRAGEQATLRYEGGKRVKLSVEPDDAAPEGLLFRIEWNGGLFGDALLTKEGLGKAFSEAAPGWKPALFFNGERIIWSKLAVNK